MTLTPDAQAILLLTAYFSDAKNKPVQPLTPAEWGKFASWLKGRDLTPVKLMAGDRSNLLNGWSDPKIPLARIEALLNRGAALALAMDRWSNAGLWVMTRSDADYPRRLKKRLGQRSPAVIFGCGNRALLDSGGLAVVGSRNASGDDLDYAKYFGEAAAGHGRNIISGGARGVDQAAMLGALECEGTVVGVLANDLLRASSSAKYRKYLLNNDLALVSTVHPEARFNVGAAMRRNAYIYCLADKALVVHSGTEGGTWRGATENLRREWVTLWVKPTNDDQAGNSALIMKSGVKAAPESISDIQEWVESELEPSASCTTGSLAKPAKQVTDQPANYTADSSMSEGAKEAMPEPAHEEPAPHPPADSSFDAEKASVAESDTEASEAVEAEGSGDNGRASEMESRGQTELTLGCPADQPRQEDKC